MGATQRLDVATSLEPDRRFRAVGCKSYPTRVWDTAQDKLLAELPSVTSPGGDFEPAYPAVSFAGDRAAIARGNTVEVYELPGSRLLRTITHSAPVSTVAFASTGRDVVSGAIDGSVLVTRDNGAVLALPMSSSGIDSAGFLPDGRVVTSNTTAPSPSSMILIMGRCTRRVSSRRIASPPRAAMGPCGSGIAPVPFARPIKADRASSPT